MSMTRLNHLVLFAAMLLVSTVFQIARDMKLSPRAVGEAAVTAIILTVLIALLSRYLGRKKGR
ncbi:MAG: hypothetical protein GXX08_02630 [Firmicutes bacterium]|nr:hypothetical protein [Bacillota bacterium]